ncbi:hypothetical protein CAC42_1261 [Sphaceloma murrayae]|uniref:Nnf1-domain-containing protein n=1 Tax=Sphaceloma murrayae TaxID=2082308 RepID=A0A2K1R2G6_9PEZI|nr:hypothetical protein CAC42_1261 [Sphaceloma murrayae]
MAAAGSRSPSPASTPPIASTPGPRAAMLSKLYDEAVTHTLQACSYDNFAACFPTSARHVPDALQGLHNDFVTRLGERCRDQFQAILEDRKVVTSLNDLDRLVEEARKRRVRMEATSDGGPVQSPVPPHTLPARSLYLAHLGPKLQAQQGELRTALEKMHAENDVLAATLRSQREEIHQVVGSVEKVVQDIDASLEVISPQEMQALTKTTVDLDVEMRPAD